MSVLRARGVACKQAPASASSPSVGRASRPPSARRPFARISLQPHSPFVSTIPLRLRFMKPVHALPLLLLALAATALRAEPASDQPVPEQLDLPTALRFAAENNFTLRAARERVE